MTVLNSNRCVRAAFVSSAIVLSLVTTGRALSEADEQQLDRDRILITDLAFKQIFEAYKISGMPFFVTSDSLLNAYHVLYEESILRIEQANAQKLPDLLRFILGRLDAVAASIGE